MPRKRLITRRALAQQFDVVMMTVTKWEQSGMPCAEPGRKGKPSLYSVVDVKKWLAHREKAARNNGTLDVTQERARKERAQAILAEQTVAIRAKELVPVDQVEKAWAVEFSAVRAKLLSWPTTITDTIHRESTLHGLEGVEKVIKAAVEELLLELSKPKRVAKPRRARTVKKAKAVKKSSKARSRKK